MTGDVFRRHRRLIIAVLGLVVIFVVLYALRQAVYSFVLGFLLAYNVMPLISWTERRLPRRGKWPVIKRGTLIIIIFIVTIVLLALVGFWLFATVISALEVLVKDAPHFISEAYSTIQGLTESFRQLFPPSLIGQVDGLALNIGELVGNAARQAFMRIFEGVSSATGLALGLFALPVFLFYIMKDWEKLSQGFYAELPSWEREHTRNIISIIEQVLGKYLRAQVTLGLAVSLITLVGLLILRVPFAPALAVFAGLTELIPMIGPWIGGATAVVVTLAVAPEKVLWVTGLFIVVQLLENNLLVPRIEGGFLGIHPAFTIMLLVIGGYVAGFFGFVLAVPLGATVWQIYRYVRRNAMVDETK
ncbi:AI-2E family transporter [Chloroflexota bacterium]